MPEAAPLSAAPLSVTVLPVPTFALAKEAVPPVRLTLARSAPRTPVSDVDVTVAVALPLYTLFAAVKFPVISLAVMLAVVVIVDDSRL